MATDPDPQHWLLLPLLGPRGETHSRAGEGTGGPNSDKGTRGHVLAELLFALERWRGTKTPWEVTRGKWFLAQFPEFPRVRLGEVYPVGHRHARRGKFLKQTAGGPWAVHAALWGHCGASAGVLAPPCPLCEVEQGPPHDGAGAVEERLVVGRAMSITPDEHCRCTGQGVWQLRW